jgi:hypothetical protein
MYRMTDQIPERVRRFLLTSIPTVPHLETLLLLWREPGDGWASDDIARRLYVPGPVAAALAEDLQRADLLEGEGEPPRFRCRREPPELAALLEDLDRTYARQLRAVASLIHSHVDRTGSRFAEAFSLRKEKQ